MEAKAIAKYVRMSPIKLKPVADLVRGKDLNEALTILWQGFRNRREGCSISGSERREQL